MTGLAAAPAPPRYVRVTARSNAISVRVVTDFNSFVKVVSLRSIVYMGEQECPFEEEFDGCDLSGVTHLLAERDAEPIGAMRLRWFADFVKFERVAVRAECRDGQVMRALLSYAIEIASRRGYSRALGYIQTRLEPLWRRFGFYARPNRPSFIFSDHEYLEVQGLLEPHANPITMDTCPMMLLRADGAWDMPGPLDRSASRGATNPHR